MSDLRDLPDLADDVRERVDIRPETPFRWVHHLAARRGGIIGARSARRRRRSPSSACAQPHGRPAMPSRLPPRPDPADRRMSGCPVRQRHQRRRPFDSGHRRRIVAMWRALEQARRPSTGAIRKADGSVHGRLEDVPVAYPPCPGGWSACEMTAGLRSSASDGSSSTPISATSRRAPAAGDVVVTARCAVRLLTEDGAGRRVVECRSPPGAYLAPTAPTVTCSRR